MKWYPKDAERLQARITELGRKGSKMDRKRIAEKAGVSRSFLNSLLPINPLGEEHERTKISVVLRAVGLE